MKFLHVYFIEVGDQQVIRTENIAKWIIFSKDLDVCINSSFCSQFICTAHYIHICTVSVFL